MVGKNRIVVDYGDYEGLVLLGAFNTETGNEIPYSELKLLEGFDIVKKYDGIKDYNTLKQMVDNNAEGFVVRFSNGDRMKIKGEEYIRLHRIMTNISTTGIWEMLSNGDNVNELLKDVPDEFYQKIKNYANELKYAHYQISEQCGKSHYYFRYGKYSDKEVEPTKKEYAEHVMKHSHPNLRSVMFAMWDGKPYDKIIWNILKPEFKKL
jgi:RNA ligase